MILYLNITTFISGTLDTVTSLDKEYFPLTTLSDQSDLSDKSDL